MCTGEKTKKETIPATDLSFSLSHLKHMRKRLLPLLLFVLYLPAFAQKKFFSEGTALVHLYFDDYFIDKDNWPAAFAKGAGPSAIAFDSLTDQSWGAIPFRINSGTGGGVQFRLMRDLSLFREGSRSKVFWHTGMGLRNFERSSGDFSGFVPFIAADTTKVYYSENESFRLKQTYLELYNSLRYEFYGKLLRKMYAFAGAGMQFSFAVTNKIEDTYHKSDLAWNTARRNWEYINTMDTVTKVKARKMHTYDWTIPLGIGFIASEWAKFELGMEYFHRKRTSDPGTERKYSEGAMFQILIRFNL